MHLPTFIRRDALSPASTEVYENSCSGSLSWFRWCPIDFILWALILVVVSLVCWKIYSTNRVGQGESLGHGSSKANQKRYKRLMLSYPSGLSEPSPVYRDGFENERKHEVENHISTHIDPYHVVKSIDDSLISKDSHFNGASMPQRILDQKKSGKLSGMGLGLDLNIIERDSPIPEYIEGTSEKKQARLLTPPPPPAYLHNARWDHV